MSIQEQDLLTEDLVAGDIRSGEKTASTATYHRGQLVGRIDATKIYGPYDATGTYDVLNETDIPVGAAIIVSTDFAGVASGTAVLSNGVLYVDDATDAALAVTARDLVAGLEKVRAVVSLDTELVAEGQLPVYIAGSELNSAGLKDAAGAVLTVTSTIVESAQDSAIIIK